MGHIRSYTHTVLTTQDLHLCLGRLEWTRRRISRQTDVEHVQNLNRRFGTRLLLDFRVVDLPRSSNRIVVTLPSFMPLFFKGLFKAITLPGQRWSLRPWNPIRAFSIS
jgi:hypothetical protein